MALKNKVALITGSTSGIGLGIAHVLAAEGYHIVLNGFGDAAEIEKTRQEIESEFGVKSIFAAADVTDYNSVAAMVADAESKLGAVDVIVNNAGIQFVSPIDEFPLDKWNQIISINLTGVFHGIRAALPGMKKRGYGRIINIASAHGLVASTGKGADVAAKHGVVGLTKVTALENARANITCNAICPGWVLTPLVQKVTGRLGGAPSGASLSRWACSPDTSQPSGIASMQRPFNRTFGRALWLLLTLAGCANAPEPAAPPPVPIGATTGTLGEAPYLNEVPANWNHELVMYLHGYEPKGAPRELPLAANDFDRWLLGKGYAVARSAFASQGWAVAEAMQDNERLREHALTLLGKPRRTWLIGHSLGGLLVLASLEQHPQAYDGGLSLCRVRTSADELIARGALDPLAVFDHYFPGVLGLAPAGLADPASPMFVEPAVIEAALVGNAERAAQIGARF